MIVKGLINSECRVDDTGSEENVFGDRLYIFGELSQVNEVFDSETGLTKLIMKYANPSKDIAWEYIGAFRMYSVYNDGGACITTRVPSPHERGLFRELYNVKSEPEIIDTPEEVIINA